LTGLTRITGENLNFIGESNAVLKEIKTFDGMLEQNKFPDDKRLKQGIYNVLRDRLHKISEANPIYYQDLIKNDSLNDRINKFVGLENVIFDNPIDPPVSNTYNEVEKAATQEQDV
jgi:hypothetical protein